MHWLARFMSAVPERFVALGVVPGRAGRVV
jgi:hypothetical protein